MQTITLNIVFVAFRKYIRIFYVFVALLIKPHDVEKIIGALMIIVMRKCDLSSSNRVIFCNRGKSRFILSPSLATYLLRPNKKQRYIRILI